MQIQKDIPLQKHTTFKIGGPADYFVKVKNFSELKEAVTWAQGKLIPFFILGGGSNLLAADQGFQGLVIKINNQEFKILEKEKGLIEAGAGWNLKQLIEKCWENNLVGMEKLYGIYGTLGGAIRGNAGAFGAEMADFVEEVKVFSLCHPEFILGSLKNSGVPKQVWDDNIIILKKDVCQFFYRHSIFKEDKNLIIISAQLKLSAGDVNQEKNEALELWHQRCNSQDMRPSAGCVFKNIKGTEFEQFIKDNPEVRLPAKFMEHKTLAASWLIDECELKGFELGGVKISEKHANFIINFNKGTAEDVIKLISMIKMQVRGRFKTELQEEIEMIGF